VVDHHLEALEAVEINGGAARLSGTGGGREG
jgi:hypothetical protein